MEKMSDDHKGRIGVWFLRDESPAGSQIPLHNPCHTIQIEPEMVKHTIHNNDIKMLVVQAGDSTGNVAAHRSQIVQLIRVLLLSSNSVLC